MKPTVLFLCTGNSARSQMAEALLRHHAGDHLLSLSAGTHPQGVNALTVKAMEEVGIGMAEHTSKDVGNLLERIDVSHLVTVCSNAEETCPTLRGNVLKRHHWPFDDPAAVEGSENVKLEEFRRIRGEIETRIRRWLKEEFQIAPRQPVEQPE